MSNTERNIFSNVIFLCTNKDLILNSLVTKDQRYFISDKVKMYYVMSHPLFNSRNTAVNYQDFNFYFLTLRSPIV